MNLADLDWTKLKPQTFCGIRLQQWMIYDPNIHCGYGIGVDPGKNFGITIVSPFHLWTASGRLDADGEAVYLNWRAFLTETGFYVANKTCPVVIEGASYGDRYGQVGLAEIRFGIKLAFEHMGFDIITVPPQSIRKAVFGSAKIQGKQLWSINPNAADSVPMALYAGGYRHDPKAPLP